jgi:hypothetical protein
MQGHYLRRGSVGSAGKIADNPQIVKFLGGQRCKTGPNIIKVYMREEREMK